MSLSIADLASSNCQAAFLPRSAFLAALGCSFSNGEFERILLFEDNEDREGCSVSCQHMRSLQYKAAPLRVAAARACHSMRLLPIKT